MSRKSRQRTYREKGKPSKLKRQWKRVLAREKYGPTGKPGPVIVKRIEDAL